jgi:hypothetical protein
MPESVEHGDFFKIEGADSIEAGNVDAILAGFERRWWWV